ATFPYPPAPAQGYVSITWRVRAPDFPHAIPAGFRQLRRSHDVAPGRRCVFLHISAAWTGQKLPNPSSSINASVFLLFFYFLLSFPRKPLYIFAKFSKSKFVQRTMTVR